VSNKAYQKLKLNKITHKIVLYVIGEGDLTVGFMLGILFE